MYKVKQIIQNTYMYNDTKYLSGETTCYGIARERVRQMSQCSFVLYMYLCMYVCKGIYIIVN